MKTVSKQMAKLPAQLIPTMAGNALDKRGELMNV
jgi:hypothetical protein